MKELRTCDQANTLCHHTKTKNEKKNLNFSQQFLTVYKRSSDTKEKRQIADYHYILDPLFNIDYDPEDISEMVFRTELSQSSYLFHFKFTSCR